MQNVRRCKQCGEAKQLTSDFFRPYYGANARGHYRVCKVCESINNRYKYLTGKGDAATPADLKEIKRIEELYDLLRELGLEPPKYGAGTPSTVYSVVEELLKRKQQQVVDRKEHGVEANVPTELAEWLSKPLTEEPEHYSDVYFKLREKYMPVVGMNPDTTPKYDETYKDTLEAILDRFDEYEDNYVYEKD